MRGDAAQGMENHVRAKGDPPPRRNRTPAAQFRSEDVEARRDGRCHIDQSVVAGLTGINVYESPEPDNVFSDGLTFPTGVFR